jgi:hypothetical protein
MLLTLMGGVLQKAWKAVRTVISSASLMTLLTGDHFKCHCSAVAIIIHNNKDDFHLWGLPEASHHVCEISNEFGSVDVTQLETWIFHLFNLLYNSIIFMLAMLNWRTSLHEDRVHEWL